MMDTYEYRKSRHRLNYDIVVNIDADDKLSELIRWNENHLECGTWYWSPTGYRVIDNGIKKIRFQFMNKKDCFMFMILCT